LRAGGRWARRGLGGGGRVPIIGGNCADQQANVWDVVGGLGAREGLYCRMVFFYSCFIGF